MPRLTDIWRCGIAHAPMADIVRQRSLTDVEITWLPAGKPFTFLADPFGLYRDDQLYVFAEAYDYRVRRGTIDVLQLDAGFQITSRSTCLAEPWHLSYPFIFAAEGETWMLPEAHRSGKLTLYRATDFPLKWEAAVVLLEEAAVDASPIFFDGLWWLFYSPAGSRRDKQSLLNLAYSERLTGPWRPHPGNPVRVDRSSARPGGTPLVIAGQLIAPMQDCRRTYGGGLRMLRVTRLTPDRFEAVADDAILPRPDFAPYDEGLHTMSACGDITLIDAKRIDRSLAGLRIDAVRRIKRVISRS